ncbi:MAG: hypothetical protein M1820_010234 [Bogoriella megaspora]|nr:MAG: hypothetical protein M1820_010234 [Bogoriella megaspora]
MITPYRKMKALIWFTLLWSLTDSAAVTKSQAKVNYDGFKVLRIANTADVALKSKINKLSAHVLTCGEGPELDVAVAPENIEAFNALAIDNTVIDEDLGSSLAAEGPFAPYADHQQFVRDLQAAFPSNSEVINSGTSVQGRSILGLHIFGSGTKGTKPAILFHGTVHAREWIATMTAEYMAYQLLTNYNSDTTVKAIVDKFDFYILPIVNPDGFSYTQTNDRLWRKNRQTVSGNTCVGRDINRNWPYKWELTNGASTDPCDETYKGQAAGDAPENKGLVTLVSQLRASQGIRLYIDFHSYGQYILWPFGYDCNAVSPKSSALTSLGRGAQSAIAAAGYNTQYTIGPSCSTLYATTGDSVDYIDAVGNATYAYTIELRDTGRSGFVLPANQIQPTVTETWAGVKYMLGRA